MPIHHSQPPEGVGTGWGEVGSLLLWPLRRPALRALPKTHGSGTISARSGYQRLDSLNAKHNTENPRSENRGPLLTLSTGDLHEKPYSVIISTPRHQTIILIVANLSSRLSRYTSDLKRLKETEAELSQYKKMYAELARENYALKDLIEKKL